MGNGRNKRRAVLILALLLSLAAATGDNGCAAAQEAGEEPLRCISFYSSVNGLNSTVFYITQSIGEYLQGEEGISLSVYCLPSDLYESLDYKIKTAAALDMDVMILSNMPQDLDEAVWKELEENELFVLVVDGSPSEYPASACIGTDNWDAGVQAARLAAQREGEQHAGIVATSFRSNQISDSRKERRDGFCEEAQNQEGLTVEGEIVCTSDTLEAMAAVREFLEENPAVNVLYCLDSSSGIIVSEILRQQGMGEQVYVLCFDQTEQVSQEMEQGGIDGVLVQDTDQIGVRCGEFLIQMRQAEDWEQFCGVQIGVPCQILEADGG